MTDRRDDNISPSAFEPRFGDDADQQAGAASATGSTMFRAIVLIGLVVLTGIFAFSRSGGAGGPDLVNWTQGFDQGLQSANAANKPMLVLFTADWCPPCQNLKRTVFSRQALAERINGDFVPVKVDMTNPGQAENNIAGKLNVQYLPTMIVLAPGGMEQGRTGPMSAEGLTGWLKNYTTR